MRRDHAATLRSAASDGVGGPPGARVLVVEDDGVLALDLAETLDEHGIVVDIARDGAARVAGVRERLHSGNAAHRQASELSRILNIARA